MPIPSSRSYLGFAVEATRNTAVAPTMSVPFTALTVHDEITWIDDVGVRGSMVDLYGSVAGPTWGLITMSGQVYPDAIQWPLASLLPLIVSSGSGPYVQKYGVLNTGTGQPSGFTITDYQGITTTSGARYWAGANCSKLVVKWDGAKDLTYDADWTSIASTAVPSTAPTKTFGTLLPTPAWIPSATTVPAVSIGGTTYTTAQLGDLTIERPVTLIHTADGLQAPYSIFSGPVKASGNITFVAEDETQLAFYLANTQQALSLTWGATENTTSSMNFTFTKCQYRMADVVRSKDYVELQVTWQAVANTTDINGGTGYGVGTASMTTVANLASQL